MTTPTLEVPRPETTATSPARRIAPGPKGMPFLGVLPEFVKNPTGLILKCVREFNDIARLQLGPYETYLIINPELVKQVLQDNNANYCRGKIYERFKIFFGVGLLTLEGETWLMHRRTVQPSFHLNSLNNLVNTMAGCTTGMLQRWQRQAEKGEKIDAEREMTRLSLRILGKSFLNFDFNDEIEEYLRPSLNTVLEVTTQQMYAAPIIDSLPRWVPIPDGPRTRKVHRQFEKLVYKVIADHRRGEADQHDFVSMLLDARDKKTGEPLTDKQIYDEIMTLVLAGYETVGTGAAWALYVLSQHPEVLRRLEAEIDEVLGGRAPTVEDLPCLPYLQMVIEETLRLYPPIWAFPRDAVNDDVVGGYHIPAGSSILISPYATQHNSNIWENPEAFDPERFSPEKAAGRSRFTYYPFGGGQRQCIGNRYAMLQMQVVVAMIVQQFRLHLVTGARVELGTLLSLHPKKGIPMTLHPR